MFFDTLVKLCNDSNIALTNFVTNELKMSKGNVTKWKEGMVPRSDTLQKIASYFNVSTDYLLGNEQKEKPTDELGELTEQEQLFMDTYRQLSPGAAQRVFEQMAAQYIQEQAAKRQNQ